MIYHVDSLMHLGQIGLGAGGIGFLIVGAFVSFGLAIVGGVFLVLSNRPKSKNKKIFTQIGMILVIPFLTIQAIGLILLAIKYWYISILLGALLFWKRKANRNKNKKIQQ